MIHSDQKEKKRRSHINNLSDSDRSDQSTAETKSTVNWSVTMNNTKMCDTTIIFEEEAVTVDVDPDDYNFITFDTWIRARLGIEKTTRLKYNDVSAGKEFFPSKTHFHTDVFTMQIIRLQSITESNSQDIVKSISRDYQAIPMNNQYSKKFMIY